MSFPTVAAVSGGGNTTNSLNHTVNLPTGIVAGNLLLVFFASDGNPTIAFPAGWTELFQTASSTYVKFGAWYRIADGTEGATITVTTSASEMSAHTSYRITGYSGTPEVGVAATGASVSPNPPNLTPSWGALDTLWFAAEGNDDGTTLCSGWPTDYGDHRNDKALNSAGAAVGTARRELNAASQDPTVFTLDASERWIANTIAVKPVVTTTPTVTTADASDVEETTATTGGEITATGGLNATRRGVVYGLTSGSRTWDSGEDGDFGIGAFTRNLTGLTKGELYYFEAYATNPSGTSYGAEKTFLTKPDEPTDLNAYPGDEYIQLIWDKGDGADKTMIRYRTDGIYPTDPADGTQAYFDTGESYDHTGLTNGLTYKYRAWSYATEGGLERYSDLYSSAEATPAATPIVTTLAATDIEARTATLNGTASQNPPGDTILERGFDWDTDPGAPYLHSWTEEGEFEDGAFFYSVSSLPLGTTIYFRAKARSAGGWNYGEELTFDAKTLPGVYIVEVRDSDGNLLAILKDAYGILLEETVNAPEVLSFMIPANDSKLSYVTRLVEFWVRDVINGTVKAKAQLLIREDDR